MTSLTVALVIDRIAGRSGGAERVLINLANAISRQGHRVEVICHEPRRGVPFYPLDSDVLFTNLRPHDSRRGRLRRGLDRFRTWAQNISIYPPILRYLQWANDHGGFAMRLDRHLSATRPDVAIAFLPNAIVALGLSKRPTATRKIASLHNVPEQDFNSAERWDQNPLDRRLRRSVLTNFNTITVLLPEFRDWFDPVLHNRIAVIPNAIDPIQRPVPQAPEHRVIAVGRLAKVKRFDLLIDAWSRLPPAYAEWQCDIYGEGPLRQQLQNQIDAANLTDRVHLRGKTDRIFDAYDEASFLVHPAEFEGFGLVVGEALARGLPVVGFADCSGFNHLVRDGENGVHVPVTADRAAALSDALRHLMDAPDERARLGKNGPASVERFDPIKVLSRWLTLIEKGRE